MVIINVDIVKILAINIYSKYKRYIKYLYRKILKKKWVCFNLTLNDM